jgi:hypothetical protein
MTPPTDDQLKTALAKMLPERVLWNDIELVWIDKKSGFWSHVAGKVLDTELLHVCHLIEQGLSCVEQCSYVELLHPPKTQSYVLSDWVVLHSTWQQRTIALAKVKGIEL